MTDDLWTRDEPQSPCIQVCVIHPDERICTGCYRSIDEIAAWSRMSAQERQAVLDDLPARAPNLAKRRGGRKARMAKRTDI